MRSITFWKGTAFILAGLLLVSFFQSNHSLPKRDNQQTVVLAETSLAAQIYPEFTCPCCGQPLNKEKPCCNAMVEMIDFIDSQVETGLSFDEVLMITAKKFGLDRLAKEEKREEIKALLAASAPAAAPRITFTQDSYDFGNVSQKSGTVYYDFELQNDGKSDLVVNKLGSSCGCTSASVIYKGEEGPRFTMEGHGAKNPTNWQVEITPGDTAILRVYYDPTVHPDLTGPVTRTVWVFSNDPVEFEKKIMITLEQIP